MKTSPDEESAPFEKYYFESAETSIDHYFTIELLMDAQNYNSSKTKYFMHESWR
jgi:hypothetical protein